MHRLKLFVSFCIGCRSKPRSILSGFKLWVIESYPGVQNQEIIRIPGKQPPIGCQIGLDFSNNESLKLLNSFFVIQDHILLVSLWVKVTQTTFWRSFWGTHKMASSSFLAFLQKPPNYGQQLTKAEPETTAQAQRAALSRLRAPVPVQGQLQQPLGLLQGISFPS